MLTFLLINDLLEAKITKNDADDDVFGIHFQNVDVDHVQTSGNPS